MRHDEVVDSMDWQAECALKVFVIGRNLEIVLQLSFELVEIFLVLLETSGKRTNWRQTMENLI